MSLLEMKTPSNIAPLLRVRDLHVRYRQSRKTIVAVDGVSFDVFKGETVGLVGESGCGKSSLGRAVVRLENIHSGSVEFKGGDITQLRGAALKEFRRQAQIIFQDPYGSLNPRMRVESALDEALCIHRLGGRDERRARITELLASVGLESSHASRYPHEFSGGQRQRIGIARTMALQPEFIVADEPVSALDVSIQVQILNLLKELQSRHQLSYLFIAHDLAVVRYVSDRVMVMYLGRVVESAPTSLLYGTPAHPYTVVLLDAVPDIERGLQSRRTVRRNRVPGGEPATASGNVVGCPFHPRCPMARERCRTVAPVLREVQEGHFSACHFAEEVMSLKSKV